jgi:WD40 repeat protein
MHDFDDDRQGNRQDDSEVEIVDLDLPGETRSSASLLLASRFLAWQRTLNRRRVRLVTASGILFLVALILLLNVHIIIPVSISSHNNNTAQYVAQAPPVKIKPSMVGFPRKDGFACVNNVAWSPDSKYIAFVGYQKDCAQGNQMYEPGLVAVHDAFSGKLIRQLSPDEAIMQAFHKQFSITHDTLVINYASILWSPDGKNLALTFSFGFPLLAAPGKFFGVMLIPDGSGNAQVLLHFQKDNSLPVEWDLQQHKAINNSSISSLQPFVTAGTAISPIFTYRWVTNGVLIPTLFRRYRTLRTQFDDSQIGAVGDPDGGRSFTIWQPGMSTLNAQNGGVSTDVPGIYTWNTLFVAWSPDGRYLLDGFFLEGRLQLPDHPLPSRQTLADLHLQQLPVLKVRDMALQHLLLTLNTSSSNVLVSWHPDGFVLAAYNNQIGDLDLFSCVTGYEIASLLLPSPFANFVLGGSTIMRWSPDGSRLLMFDPELGMVMTWQASRLVG